MGTVAGPCRNQPTRAGRPRVNVCKRRARIDRSRAVGRLCRHDVAGPIPRRLCGRPAHGRLRLLDLALNKFPELVQAADADLFAA